MVDRTWPRWALAALLVTAAGCATQPQPRMPAQQAAAEIPAAELLDVGVRVFDPGLPHPNEHALEDEGIYPDVRKSEARYMATTLATTMQATGQWGAVRVIPGGFGQSDVLVDAKIVESNGLKLELEVLATDAKGRVLLDKTYDADADHLAYENAGGVHRDPFQHVYNAIANDLVRARQKLDPAERRELRTISELQFASDIAPEVFGGYLTTNRKGQVEIVRLPAEGDPMVERIAAIRERDALLVDTLNDHWATFSKRMQAPYDELRSFSYEEQIAMKQLRKQARIRKIVGAIALIGAVVADPASSGAAAARDLALLGGLYAIQSGMALSQEAKIHLEAIRELAGSFDAEVAPMLVDVEGETLRLTGSAEAQYEAWREMLSEIFRAETGLPVDPNAAEAAGSGS